ncbi:hypothetical protein WNY37_08080 [Henriciella sp. AS95]|uniref:hypothetical protein n=1 Tax=Henriciella sp. AS95 TaxID=3135782 RepID=UPI0031779F51
MAYFDNKSMSMLAGVVAGGIGAYLGYEQAAATGVNPFLGAAIYGGAGFVIGSAGAFLLKSLSQFLVFILLIAAILYVARDPIEQMTGMDPVDAVMNTLQGWGIPVGGVPPSNAG